jgi:hypothetical protein
MRTNLTVAHLGDLLEQPNMAGFKEPGLVIRMRPDGIRAWDFRDEVGA